MKNKYTVSLAATSLFIISSCSTSNKIAALKPEPNYNASQVVYDKQVSYVNLPVEVSIADLQGQTNKYLYGLVYEDNVLEGDNLMMKVWKQAPIQITEKAGKLHMELPLKIWARYRYGIDKFGLSVYDTREFNLNGKIRLNTVAGLANWKLTTKTQIEDIDWVESPSVSIAGKNLPITYLINPTLSVFKSRLSGMIDKAISESLDIRPYVLDALTEMSKPMEVNKEYQTWFAMQPVELYSSKAVVANKKITMNMGMKAYLETSVGRKPTLSFEKDRLQLRSIEKMPNEFQVNVAGFTTYQHAASLMQKNFAGQKFESGNRSVTVTKVDLWGKDGRIIVDLGMSGTVNGQVYLSGIPMYDPVKKEIFLDQLDFVLDSKSRLLKAADWLTHGLIVKKIAESCRFSIAETLNEGTKTMAGYLNDYEPVKGVKVNGALTELAPNKVFLTSNAMIAMIAAKGKVNIVINGME
ncbi:MAG TPA: DUF4403 family protein [Sphingobacteriaceae bacterium]